MNHNIPAPLRDLDRAIRATVANDQDDDTLAWARLVLLASPAPHPKAVARRPVFRVAVLATAVVMAALLVVPGLVWQPKAPMSSGGGKLPSSAPPLAQVDVGDPRLAPRIIELDDHGASVTLRWTDPSGGRAVFVVMHAALGPEVLATAPAATTQIRVEHLDPTRPQYCFRVIALIDAERRGVSPQRCTPTRR